MRSFQRHALVTLALCTAACGDAPDTKARARTAAEPDTPAKEARAAPEPRAPAEQPDKLVIADVGFMTPESVLHDEVADVYLVSNIEGAPTVEDGNGFISRVTPDGEVRELKWIDGFADGVTLNAPKGMAIVGETLYVADIDHVRKFDRRAGTPAGAVAIEGATFLNDLTPAPGGGVYVSDSGGDAIYRLAADDAVTPVLSGEALGNPNGLVAQGGGLRVVTYKTGESYTIDADTGERGAASKAPKGALDGIVGLPDGSFLVSSWEGKAIYRLSADGVFSEFMGELTAPADIGLDARRGRVLIPLFQDNAVILKRVE